MTDSAVARSMERKQRRTELLQTLRSIGAVGTFTRTTTQVCRALGYDADKHSRRAVAARLLAAKHEGLVWRRFRGEHGEEAQWALTDRGEAA